MDTKYYDKILHECKLCGMLLPDKHQDIFKHSCHPDAILQKITESYKKEIKMEDKPTNPRERKLATEEEEHTKIALPEITAEDVKKFFCAEASAKEIAMFLNISKMNMLNPFKREVYLIKYGSEPAQIVTGYETYLKRAERTNKYAGFKVWTEGKAPDMKACIEVYRKDWDKPLYHEVEYREYEGKKRDGTPTCFWREKPITMLKKVVISQALRFAFPDELGGMPYTAEEINIIDVETLPTENIEPIKHEITKEEVNVDGSKEVHYKEIPPEALLCSACNNNITLKVYKYSIDKFKKSLCFECQKVQ